MEEALISTFSSEFSTTFETNGYYDRAMQIDWILPVTFNILLMVATFWLLVSLIYYGIKTKKWNRKRSRMDTLNSGLVYSSVVACAFTCMLRFLISLASMNVGFSAAGDELCDALADAAFCSYAFVLCCVALFLWCRQRSFYANRLLNVNYNNVIKFFSFSSIAFIIGYGIFVIVLNTSPNRYLSSLRGCVLDPNNKDFGKYYWIAVVVGIAFYNVVLLGLLCYALTHVQSYQSKQRLKRSPSTQISTIHSNAEQMSVANQSFYNFDGKIASLRFQFRPNYFSANKIKFILQKTLTFAIISIICDVFLQIFASYITKSRDHRRVSNILFDFNSFFNLLFLIFSFASYKSIIMSPLSKISCCSKLNNTPDRKYEYNHPRPSVVSTV